MIDKSLAITGPVAIIWFMFAGYGLFLVFFAKWRREWQLRRLQAEMADSWRIPMDRLGGVLLVFIGTAVAWWLLSTNLKF
jgi:hypothetical protein